MFNYYIMYLEDVPHIIIVLETMKIIYIYDILVWYFLFIVAINDTTIFVLHIMKKIRKNPYHIPLLKKSWLSLEKSKFMPSYTNLLKHTYTLLGLSSRSTRMNIFSQLPAFYTLWKELPTHRSHWKKKFHKKNARNNKGIQSSTLVPRLTCCIPITVC
jgi:hypothetical protein